MDKKSLLYEVRKELIKRGPYLGPRGGKYSDPQRKIPWKERKLQEVKDKADDILDDIDSKAGDSHVGKRYVDRAKHLIREITTTIRADRKGVGKKSLTIVNHALERLMAIREFVEGGINLMMSQEIKEEFIKRRFRNGR